jgi:alpha-L-fucosidase
MRARRPRRAPGTARETGEEEYYRKTGVDPSRRKAFPRTTHPEAQWFGSAGLGLFVHWGIASVHGNAELSWGAIDIGADAYFRLADRFAPTRYEPERWLRAAADAGFRYAVLTARHHDGYSLWPSESGGFGVRTHLGGRDLVRPFVEACRACGLKVGLYYSPPDWHLNRAYTRHLTPEPPPMPPDHEARFRAHVRQQLVELLTRYGRIDLAWFDGGCDGAIRPEELREMQPGIVVNPRLFGVGDYITPEGVMLEHRPEGWWELCHIWNMPWFGYTEPVRYHSTGWMLTVLARVRSWGGNFLLNCGPGPDGEMPPLYYERMAELAEWMRHSASSLFEVTPGPYPECSSVYTTVRGSTWYLHAVAHVVENPVLRGVERPARALLLRTGEEVAVDWRDGRAEVKIPLQWRTELDDVVAVSW